MHASEAFTSQRLTRLLWLANAVGILLLLGAAFGRTWTAFSAASVPLPDVAPFRPATLPALPLPAEIGERNPFDVAGQAWRPAPAGAELAGTGSLRGIVLLPGARFAVTDRGMARAGDSIAGGKLLGLEARRVLVESGGRRQALDLPSEKRPRLADINRASRSP